MPRNRSGRFLTLPLIGLTFFWLTFANLSAISAQQSADTLVLCSETLRPALGEWLEYRRSQGHRVVVQTAHSTPHKNRRLIAGAAKTMGIRSVVIVGDSGDAWLNPKSLVPTDYVLAKVNVKYGSDPVIATDSRYADLDDDGVPELAIGRLPVDSAAELVAFTRRIITYENAAAGHWQRRINLIAGMGGFGSLVDKVIENTTKQILTDLVPPEFATTMTYGSWTSPYCPDPSKFSDVTIERFNEGCMFWVYMGHGHRYQLDNVRLPDRRVKILDTDLVSKLGCRQGSPIAVCLSCYTGAHDSHSDCLAESMLKQPRGPIAVVCGSRITMPYAMSVMSVGMMDEYFRGKCVTLGELMLNAKKRMVRVNDDSNPYRELLEALGQSFSPTPNLLDAECREHIHLIQLLGDPLLRVKRPPKLALKIKSGETSFSAGEAIELAGVAPIAGTIRIELAYQRDRFRQRPNFRQMYDPSEEAFEKIHQDYVAANDLVCIKKEIATRGGDFATSIQVPAGISGRCDLRVMLTGDQSIALDSLPVRIKRSSTSARRSGKKHVAR